MNEGIMKLKYSKEQAVVNFISGTLVRLNLIPRNLTPWDSDIERFVNNEEVRMLNENTGIITTKLSSHQPDHEKADMLEATARGYQILWEGTGKKHYEDSMKACNADAKDYRSCGFVRPLGATV
jgi:hypothetical protein